jgi:splicing factor 3A subunit 1
MSNPILTLTAPESNGGGGGVGAGAGQQQQQAPPPPPPPGAKAEPPATVATHTRTIGIIHPPPDIRVIIEKTATWIAKNGPGFENHILSGNGVIYLHAIMKDTGYAYAMEKFSATCVPCT